MKLGLDNISILLTALSSPENKYTKVQVAGTNGKGSVCAFLDAMCRHAGIRTGLATSPHLVSMTERVKINGRDIDEKSFARLATRVRETAEVLASDRRLDTVPTYFEQVTAIALLAFAEAEIDLAILETGMGGRLDATTAARADIVAITPIDYDHQQYLGDTLASIAAEKAAVIRSDTPVVVGEQPPEAMEAIVRRCLELNVTPRSAGAVETTGRDGRLTFATSRNEYTTDRLGLRGRHQIANAKIAILLAEALQKYFSISPEDIVAGLRTAEHPGRLQFIGRYLLDGAHNPAGALALAAFLDESVSGPLTVIFGVMQDKDVSAIAPVLFPRADRLILTRAANPRSAAPSEIAARAGDELAGRAHLTDSVPEALELAERITAPDGTILVTGSLYLVGEVMAELQNSAKTIR